jgi:two-component system NarL family sensor kinase
MEASTINTPVEAKDLRQRVAALERALAERDRRNNRFQSMVDQLTEETVRLRSLLEVHEQDRRLIGFEIHDGLAQLLSGAIMELGVFRRMVDQGDENAWKSLDTATGLVARSLQEARRLIRDLRPPELEEDGLIASIANLVAEVCEQGEMEAEFVQQVQFQRLAPTFERTVYRVVQEALANARRHSKSGKVRVALYQEGRDLQIRVEDWGIGFDLHAIGDGHYGLESIRERVRVFGGELLVQTAPGRGTSISVRLPLPEPTDRSAIRING